MVTVVQYQQHPLGESHHPKDQQETQEVGQHHQQQPQQQQQQQQQQLQLENRQYNDVHDVDTRDGESYRVEVVSSSPAKGVVAIPRRTSSNPSLGGGSTLCSEVDDNEDEVHYYGNGCDNGGDDDDDEDETDLEDGEWVADLPVSTVIQQQQVVANGDLVLPSADPSTFGDVCVKNSTNVHLGNKTFYKGPVTIKQFVYTNPASIQDAGIGKCDGISARISDANASDLSTSKGDAAADRPILPQNPDFDKVTKWLWTWRCAALLCTLALMLVTAVVISSVLLTRNGDSPPAPVFPEIPDSSLGGVIVSNVRFVERSEWGAQPPTEPLTRMKLPVPYVIISHTATEFCTTQSQCTFHVRFAQTFHIESRKWSDIAYNFLVGGDGLAYVGRSWDYMGAHSFGYNNKSIGISFIGTFNGVIPPKIQLHAAQRIIELGVEAGKIAPDYKLLGHRQISKTLSPGDALYSIIKKWPHWSPQP